MNEMERAWSSCPVIAQSCLEEQAGLQSAGEGDRLPKTIFFNFLQLLLTMAGDSAAVCVLTVPLKFTLKDKKIFLSVQLTITSILIGIVYEPGVNSQVKYQSMNTGWPNRPGKAQFPEKC